MGYREDAAKVVGVHQDEIEADLAKARRIRDRARGDLAEAERQVAVYESLLTFLRQADAEPDAPGKMTLHAAMRQILEDSPAGMMKAADIATEIERRGLYRMRDGRPVEAQQIHARVGHYPDDFRRQGTYITLVQPHLP
ncbi:hypothetical protein [Frankia sp. R43]|uniref:hypothetical protein n=1 Tax=Frankia sp. R43 TaxID=269536 RepID=UPI0006CA332C|nr:hypothetical protein [Frankia sp. R43]